MAEENNKMIVDLRKMLELIGFRHLSVLPAEDLMEILLNKNVNKEKNINSNNRNDGGDLKD